LSEDAVLLNERWMRVKILQERKGKTLPNIVTNGQKQQTAAIQAELPHGFRLGALTRE
jgi:hypothetical protein